MEISNYIKTIMAEDLKEGRVAEIVTRFPPEPNAYLHIGHARAIITNFETAASFGGKTNLRFDDTNPTKEDSEYVEAIQEDIKWLGYTPDHVFFGSDYFEKTFEKAVLLIRKGLAYVDDLTQEEISKYRGTLTEPGKESPYRNRSVEENLDLFYRMRNKEFKEGEKTLRAKIDMASANINLRDPILYRIIHLPHHRQLDRWCIYPMYDFAHPLQDSFEGITHSCCSLEFDNHRVLYDWVIENCDVEHVPHQYEFGRLNITGMVMSKRYLRTLVDTKKVSGYDDPRMPTLVGLKRRGFTADAIKNFVKSTGLSRVNSTVDYSALEEALRDDLKLKALRPNAVIRPLEVVIDNYPDDLIEYMDCPNNTECEALGTRKIAFSKHVYIEQDDFIEQKPNKKWKRLALGVEVRLMHAYFITATSVEKDAAGNIIRIHATYDPKTRSGSGFEDRKPNGNIHFVEKTTALEAEFRLYEALILEQEEGKDLDFTERLNPNSLTILKGYVEASLKDTKPLDHYQFIRNGYYVTDKESTADHYIFNRTCGLKSSFKL
ncbi:MAG TPA: glutamine--tRNA ligase/YqeY domain fusion protein [Candidatus Pelethenecus faecipullorum]|uniref:Glutamine--tRNA ligase n=1 Tax=Candidatus Pelethenecus faecipullorum TaxID=2840900 RepID=A0A9D1KIU5_9MOLU|nr:glutamine--tRNA ligase/YqeY domain fusion protein [Candidatus Pelethenecus faecipullorum]